MKLKTEYLKNENPDSNSSGNRNLGIGQNSEGGEMGDIKQTETIEWVKGNKPAIGNCKYLVTMKSGDQTYIEQLRWNDSNGQWVEPGIEFVHKKEDVIAYAKLPKGYRNDD